VRRTGGRKLFGKERKEVFLEWFAATCNARLSAEKAGVSEKTVYKHLAKDPEFLDGFGRAVQVGYVRLEARELQEAQRFGVGRSGAAEGGPSTITSAGDGPPPHAAEPRREEYEVRCELDPASTIESSFDGPTPRPGEEYQVRCELDPELVEEHFNPELALQLLREHRRHLPGSAERRPHQRTTARSATNKEIAETLAKRLKGFGLRVQREQLPAPDGGTTNEA
jgi:hypothetical protein